MQDEEEELAASVVGRLTALEILVTNLVITTISQHYGQDAVAGTDVLKAAVFRTSQMAERPIGEFHDQVWEEAVKSLETIFAEVRSRLAGLVRR
jgi:hypothetical protein